MLGESIYIPGYEEELLIKWSVLNFSSEEFVKAVNKSPELLIKLQEISDKNNEEAEKYIETLDEKYKELCNDFKEEKQIIDVLKTGEKRFEEGNIGSYIFLSNYAPKEPEEKIELKIEPGADLTGADLTGADLTAADLTAADLTGADLRGAELEGADLRRADLTGADLTGANIDETCFKSILKSVNWKEAKFDTDIIDKLEKMKKFPNIYT